MCSLFLCHPVCRRSSWLTVKGEGEGGAKSFNGNKACIICSMIYWIKTCIIMLDPQCVVDDPCLYSVPMIPGRGVTKRCRLSLLNKSALVIRESKCREWGELRGLSQWVQLCTSRDMEPNQPMFPGQRDLVGKQERIDAMELLGATFVDKKRDMLGALGLWKRAMEERWELCCVCRILGFWKRVRFLLLDSWAMEERGALCSGLSC